MITLHESNITQFPEDNGIGVLDDAISAYAEEELNGLFEFEMEYDSEGSLVDELKEERIIKAYAQDKLGYQLFRIYSITKNHENDNLIVNAQHITYDLANNFVEEMKASGLTKKQVMEKIGSEAVNPHTFNVTSSNNSTQSSTELYRTNPLQMIAGMDGSVLQIWGGQIERDNFNLIMHDRRGHDDGVTVTYEKNITGLTAGIDISNLVTAIFPFVYIEATEDEPERLITVESIDGYTKYIVSDKYEEYTDFYIEPVDYSSDDRIDIQDKTDAQIRTQLRSVASEYFNETGNDKPKSTMEVSFAHLWETEEYKDVAPLELVGMGDNVSINHSKLDVEATAIVNYIRYDCIALVNEEVKLGSVKARFSDSINKIDRIEKEVEDAKNDANQAIVSANGKNTTYYGPDEPTGDIKKGDLWFQVIDGEYHRTYRYDGIEWQLIVDMASEEAKQEASQAKDRADEAYDNASIAAGNAADALEEAISNATDIEEFAYTITGDESITTLAGTAGVLQSKIVDIDGNINTLTQTVDATISRIENMSGNMITHNPEGWVEAFNFIGIKGGVSVKKNTDYILTDFSDEEVDNIQVNFGGKSIDIGEDGTLIFNSGDDNSIGIIVSTNDSDFLEKLGTVYRFKLEEGTESTAWTAHDKDTYTQYSQLTDAINLRVQKGDVINQINISEESVLISGEKLILDGDTTINGSFKVDNANILNIDAAKINVGELIGHSLVGGEVIGGYIEQQSGSSRLEMHDGRIDSFYNNQLAMQFGQYSLDFYNRSTERIGRVIPVNNSSDPNEKGLGIIVEEDFINIGYQRGSTYHAVFRSSQSRNLTTISGPYNNLNNGSMLRLFANRRQVSEGRFSSHDQPSIILDQSDTTNDVDVYFGGFNRRANAEARFRHRSSDSSYSTKLTVASTHVRVHDELRVGGSNVGIESFSNAALFKFNNNRYLRISDEGTFGVYRGSNPIFRVIGSNGGLEVTGSIVAPDIYSRTTGNSTNVHVFNTGRLARSTSARKYKNYIETVTDEIDYKKILDFEIKSWNDKGEVERNNNSTDGLKRYYGLIADEFVEKGLPEFAVIENGEVENYSDRAWVTLIPNIRDNRDEITILKEKVETQQEIIDGLLMKVARLEGTA